MKYDVIIIGGGIMGSVINYELAKYKIKTLQLEKNPYIGSETTTGNSGLIHGGFDAKPNSLIAKANMEGAKIWFNDIFKNMKFSRAIMPSLVLAFSDEEHKHIEELYKRGLKNGVKASDMKIIYYDEIKKLEPEISDKAKSALYCTTSWGVDPVKATKAFAYVALQNGNDIKLNAEVIKIDQTKDGFDVYTQNDKISSKFIVNAAGHYADKISKMAGCEDYTLKTRRGQYLILSATEAPKVKNVCFMVPTIHGKGVVVAPNLDGRVQVGPTAKEGVLKEDTRIVERKLWEEVEKIGKHLIPSIDYTKVEKVFGGSRPIHPSGDFYIKADDINNKFIQVAGIKSPGISAAPYISQLVANILKKSGANLELKNNFNPKIKIL